MFYYVKREVNNKYLQIKAKTILLNLYKITKKCVHCYRILKHQLTGKTQTCKTELSKSIKIHSNFQEAGFL